MFFLWFHFLFNPHLKPEPWWDTKRITHYPPPKRVITQNSKGLFNSGWQQKFLRQKDSIKLPYTKIRRVKTFKNFNSFQYTLPRKYKFFNESSMPCLEPTLCSKPTAYFSSNIFYIFKLLLYIFYCSLSPKCSYSFTCL